MRTWVGLGQPQVQTHKMARTSTSTGHSGIRKFEYSFRFVPGLLLDLALSIENQRYSGESGIHLFPAEGASFVGIALRALVVVQLA